MNKRMREYKDKNVLYRKSSSETNHTSPSDILSIYQILVIFLTLRLLVANLANTK